MTQDMPFSEYLDDYFAECDEHLTSLRRDLLALESLVDQPRVDQPLLDRLLRALHTIKGLSGMVSVSAAEQLAHHTESVLRALRRAQLYLTAEVLDALMVSARTLEQVITALRLSQPAPDVAPVMAQLVALAPDAPPLEQKPESPAPVTLATPNAQDKARQAAARHPDAQFWRFEFTPAPELAARGVSVDVIRSRLQEIGELVSAAPQVTGQGTISFEFLVAAQVDEADLAPWAQDGLSWTPYQVAPPAPAFKDEPAPLSITPPSVVRV
ncbi:MAG: chemotaxis protein CheA, partial [Delftia sp.]|nr:chemotaxis protein CheA [Delftia sp.]